MITKFKLFELYGASSTAQDLIDAFGSDYIDDYFMENYEIDVDEIIELYPDIIKNHINDEKFVNSWITDEINSLTIEDFSDWDYKEYIKENIDEELENEAIKVYKEGQDIEDEDLEYDDSMLDELEEYQLREIIEKCDKEEEFIEYTVHQRYDGQDAMEIIDEIYGKISGKELYNIVKWYTNDDDIIEEYKKNVSDDHKEEIILENLANDDSLIDYLIEKDEKNVLLLANYFVEEDITSNYAYEYEFQEKYIQQSVKDYFDGIEYDEKEEEEVIADALVFLNKHFTINWRIEEEYDDYMYKVSIEKYNM